jgi:hypothetical protein
MTHGSQSARQEEFALLVEHVTATHKSFIDSTAKVTGFLLLALGWFATSDAARQFLSSNLDISVLAAISVAAAYLLSVVASWVAYRVSCDATRRLKELSYLPETAYQGRVLGTTTFLVCVAGNGVLALLLMYALLTAK